MASDRVFICCSPYMSFRRAKTRSHDAELGEIAKTMRAANAHAGKDLPLPRYVAAARLSTVRLDKWEYPHSWRKLGSKSSTS